MMMMMMIFRLLWSDKSGMTLPNYMSKYEIIGDVERTTEIKA
jgi:hypothetical protein